MLLLLLIIEILIIIHGQKKLLTALYRELISPDKFYCKTVYNVFKFDDDDDEDIVIYITRPRKPKVYKTRRDYLVEFDEEQFFFNSD